MTDLVVATPNNGVSIAFDIVVGAFVLFGVCAAVYVWLKGLD